MYFTVVTTTSLGYGDMVPHTAGGLSIACVLCILGISVLALPIAVIGGNFDGLYSAYYLQIQDKNDRNEIDIKDLQDLDAVAISTIHEQQCKKLSTIAENVADKASLQAAAFTRATELLNVIVERSRRAHLAKVMISIKDFRLLLNLHRIHRPATPEQVRKWNAPPASMTSSKYGGGSNTASEKMNSDKSILPSQYAIICLTVKKCLHFFTNTLPSLLVPGETWMVPRIYIFRSPLDLYFPEVQKKMQK